jgi:iron(III) transport system ATP-binding protein
MESIVLKNVTKKYGDVAAVENVSLEIKAGTMFFILGPSGCGKTTLLRMIAGFCDLDHGEILFGARSLTNVPPAKRNVSMVFQNYALWPHMSVRKNVAYGLEERKVSRREQEERVVKALKSVRMEQYADRMPNELSGVQQQRIALARALVVEPGAVLLDEPLSNLDAKLRNEMRHEIRRIHDETGITMVYVTHDQKEALGMADQIAVMSMGRIEQMADPRTVYSLPLNIFVAEFMGDANLLPGTLVETGKGTAVIKTGLGAFKARITGHVPAKGEKCFCMIRPEKLRSVGNGENHIKAVVTDSVFSGETELYRLNADGVDIRLLAFNPSVPLAAGQSVDLNFDAADALILI